MLLKVVAVLPIVALSFLQQRTNTMKESFNRVLSYLLSAPPPIDYPKVTNVSHGFVIGKGFNRQGKTFKRNRRYQIKHGFKAKR